LGPKTLTWFARGASWRVGASALIHGAGAIALLLGLTACPQEAASPGPKAGGASGSGSGLKYNLEMKAGTGKTVAIIGEGKLTVGDLQARLDRQSPFIQARYKEFEKRKDFLEQQVKFEVLAQEAISQGLHEAPEVAETVKKMIVQKLTRDQFDGRLKASDVDEAEMRKYYDSHKIEYNKPQMYRASLIKISIRGDAKAAEKKAKLAHAAATKKETLGDRKFFRTLVAEYSDDEKTKKLGGDTRYLSAAEFKAEFGEAIEKAVWAIPGQNDVSDIITTSDAYYIIKKTGERKPITREFEKVQNQIRNLLFRERKTEAFEKYIDELKAKYKVTTTPEHLKELKVKSDLPEGMVPPEHGGDKFGHPPPPSR